MEEKEYAVSVCYPCYATLHVKANSEAEALARARGIDLGGEEPMEFETDFSAKAKYEIEED